MKIENPWLLFLGLAIGPFIAGVDLLAIAVAIEPMKKALSMDLATLQWLLSAYAIGRAGFLVAAGKLSDFYGIKKTFILSFLIFVLASIAVIATNSSSVIIIARFIQGISSGGLAVISIAAVMVLFSPEERTGWISGLIGAAGVGMAFGPPIGGLLIHLFDWRMIFLINIPIGFVGISLAYRYLPKTEPHPRKGESIDWFGVAIISLLLSVLAFGISFGHYWGWFSGKMAIAAACALILLIAFVISEKKAKEPLLDFSFFKIKNFFAANFAGFTLYLILTAWTLIFGIYLQKVLNMTAFQSGLAFLPFGIVLALFSTQMQKLAKIFDPKVLIVWGYVICTLTFFALSLIAVKPSLWLLSFLFASFAVSFLLINSNSLPAALEFIPKEKGGLVSGISMMIRWLGGALGAPIITAIFLAHATTKMQEIAKDHQDLYHQVITGEAPSNALASAFQGQDLTNATNIIDRSFHNGLTISMLYLAILSVITLIISQLFLKKKRLEHGKN